MTTQKVIGIVYNQRVPRALTLAQELHQRYGNRKGSWVCSATELEALAPNMASTQTLITVGGDGTILQAMRIAAPDDVPILGVNLGRVGFMTELSPDEALERVGDYLANGEEWVEERAMLQAEVLRNGQPETEIAGQYPDQSLFHALNDIVVARGSATRLVHVAAKVNGQPLTTYYADGVIVATATGSTGYTLAVGGPILHPQSPDLLLAAVAPHLSFNTPLVLPASSTIDLTLDSDYPAVLSVDGLVDVALTGGDTVRVRQSPYKARFLRSQPTTYFYHALTQRLNLDKGWSASRTQGPA